MFVQKIQLQSSKIYYELLKITIYSDSLKKLHALVFVQKIHYKNSKIHFKIHYKIHTLEFLQKIHYKNMWYLNRYEILKSTLVRLSTENTLQNALKYSL